jgi:hypothetical protein
MSSRNPDPSPPSPNTTTESPRLWISKFFPSKTATRPAALPVRRWQKVQWQTCDRSGCR